MCVGMCKYMSVLLGVGRWVSVYGVWAGAYGCVAGCRYMSECLWVCGWVYMGVWVGVCMCVDVYECVAGCR